MTIAGLTPLQKTLIPSYIEKWERFANSNDPLNRDYVRSAIHLMYHCGGIEPPQEIVFVESIQEMTIAFMAYDMQESYPDLKLADCWAIADEAVSRGAISDTFEDQLIQAFYETLPKTENLAENIVWGNLDSTLYEYDFAKEVLGQDVKEMEGLLAVGRECGMLLPYDTVCIVCKRISRKELEKK